MGRSVGAAGRTELAAAALGRCKGRLGPLADQGAFLLGKADLDTILTPSCRLAEHVKVRPSWPNGESKWWNFVP
jgi:hypothetical protein